MREVGGKFGWGKAYVHLWLFHVAVWWKPSQHCTVIILQLKIKFKKQNIKQKADQSHNNMDAKLFLKF